MAIPYTYIGRERFPLPVQQDEPQGSPAPEAPKKRKASRVRLEETVTPEVPDEAPTCPDGSCPMPGAE